MVTGEIRGIRITIPDIRWYQRKDIGMEFFIIVTLQLSSDNNTERESKVLELYKEGKKNRYR
jgi:hypothetical protein